MSHFIVTVALASPDAALDPILEPYDENKAVEPYPTQSIAEITADEHFQWYLINYPDLTVQEALQRWVGVR